MFFTAARARLFLAATLPCILCSVSHCHLFGVKVEAEFGFEFYKSKENTYLELGYQLQNLLLKEC